MKEGVIFPSKHDLTVSLGAVYFPMQLYVTVSPCFKIDRLVGVDLAFSNSCTLHAES